MKCSNPYILFCFQGSYIPNIFALALLNQAVMKAIQYMSFGGSDVIRLNESDKPVPKTPLT